MSSVASISSYKDIENVVLNIFRCMVRNPSSSKLQGHLPAWAVEVKGSGDLCIGEDGI